MEGIDIQKEFGDFYTVYSDGRIYSKKDKKFVHYDTSTGYCQAWFYVNRIRRRIKVHRIVAYCFCNPPENYRELVINHIDGVKMNNDYTNLEWCTHYHNNKHARETGLNNISESNSRRWRNPKWRKRTAENISKGRISTEASKGKNNPRFRYEITDEDNNEYLINDLAELFECSYSCAYLRVQKYLRGNIHEDFKKHKITVTDIKGKVNRLSNVQQEEKAS